MPLARMHKGEEEEYHTELFIETHSHTPERSLEKVLLMDRLYHS